MRRGQKGGLSSDLTVEQMQEQEALGRSKGVFSTKIQIQCEGLGKPMQFVILPGQAMRRLPLNRVLYRERNRIERLINRLKQARRIATRYEKRAENYLAIITIGAILLWL